MIGLRIHTVKIARQRLRKETPPASVRDLASLFPSIILRFHSTFVECSSFFTICADIEPTSMTENSTRFAELLTRAINHIHADEGKPKTVVRDELGYAAGREGRTAIDYWRRDGGHIPADLASLEGLAREIARRGGLSAVEMTAFLMAACHPDAQALSAELYARNNGNPPEPTEFAARASVAEDSGNDGAPAPGPTLPLTPAPLPIFDTEAAQSPAGSRRISRAALFALGMTAVGVALVALIAITAWARQRATPSSFEVGQIQLVEMEGARLEVRADGRDLLSGESVRVNTPVTVTFWVMNNSVGPVTLRSLVIGTRGPGVTCATDPEARWSALDVPFPPVTDLVLQPGEEYSYQGVRAFYRPGVYFLEPTEQDITGYWGGIPAFTCFDLVVIE